MTNLHQTPQKNTVLGHRLPLMSLAISFVLLACCSLIVINGWLSWNGRQHKLQDAEKTAVNLSSALSQQADDTFSKIDTVLATIVQRWEGDNETPHFMLYPWLASIVSQVPELESLFLFDENGNILLSSMDDVWRPSNPIDLPYLNYHRSQSTRSPRIGLPMRSRQSHDWVIPVSRRLNNPDGSFDGMVVAFLKASAFSQYYGSFDIGRQGVILLSLDDGMPLLRQPFLSSASSQTELGVSLSDYPLPSNSNGILRAVSPADKVERIIAYRHLPHYPLVVSTALSQDEVLDSWRADTLQLTLVLSLMSILLALLGLRMIRQIRKHARIEAELHTARSSLLRLNDALGKLALQDALTGLANRRQFDETLQKEFQRAIRDKTSLGMIMIDVDYFKQYNDLYGHPAGDECLRSIGNIIRMNRPGDLAARYGGEEFVVLLPGTDLAGTLTVANNIRNGVLNLRITHKGNGIGMVSASFGIHAITPAHNDSDPMQLLRQTDLALYTAKERGRNCVCAFDDKDTPSPDAKEN
ncbi:sensor domain-containing diguanylate cyclase [Herbaspirillum sp. RTI4]|uniref:sensor domain-containing diguanylate cyclase n=1 Tax=Herbaspirillum sp. RTI4 TaxID=3048640 RepID=UPI002AB5C187|nr:sensor domain-containing diguanylate cyclase [Herbaspirillum sp. RTI4]MDY7579400.1 sensor domain-containing diguanylate cyclase [Herbaspirillum sp. RTI4]MEA9980314.1 sensor domain-containing diguanylate cyclase [Herbaspirillum sp. RTI4]